ncbi:hypothetical protein [Isachenkonia alkalipeptolytica]|nr:hypothetical protein [Isachenkonia alkalipeptolytica]
MELYVPVVFIVIVILVSIQYSLNKIIVLLREIKDILYYIRKND